MLRLLLAGLCALVMTAGVAQAEGAVCTSIRDNGNDCAPLPRVTAKGNLKVEVFTRKRSVSLPLGAAGDDMRAEYEASCPGGKCVCDEDVRYLEFKGPVPGFRQVNAFEHAAGARAKCSIENSNVMRTPLHFAVSPHFVSTAVYELEYCRTCGGSCHGSTVLATYDAKTGNALLARDALRADRIEALRQHVADYFVKTHLDEGQRAGEKAKLLQDLSTRTFADEGVYVENGVVFLNLDRFALSCADGSFFPVPVPAEFIVPPFAALLRGAP